MRQQLHALPGFRVVQSTSPGNKAGVKSMVVYGIANTSFKFSVAEISVIQILIQ